MEWLYFSARPIVIPGPLFLAVSTVIVRLRCHLLWCSTSVEAFVFDSRFVFKSWLKQTVHIMAVALLFCAITLPIQCTTYWSPFQGCVQCTWHSVILHLFYFWPILHCILRLTLNYLSFFYIISVLPLHPSLKVITVHAGAPLNSYFIPFFRQKCLAAEEKTAFVTLMVPHAA